MNGYENRQVVAMLIAGIGLAYFVSVLTTMSLSGQVTDPYEVTHIIILILAWVLSWKIILRYLLQRKDINKLSQ